MSLFDTHCHIHEATFELKGDNATRALWLRANKPDPDELVANALKGDVVGMICVGTTAADSELAVRFVQDHDACWAGIGIHPHEAKGGRAELKKLEALLKPPRVLPEKLLPNASQSTTDPALGVPSFLSPGTKNQSDSTKNSSSAPNHTHPYPNGAGPLWSGDATLQEAAQATYRPRVSGVVRGDGAGQVRHRKIVAIGECGLDYYYSHSPKEDQIETLRFQIELALKHDLPLIFHVRDAFDDFWPIFDDYKGIRGVVHSFTDTSANLKKLLDRGLYVGINGIITFTKNDWQLNMAKTIPLDRLVLETDAPFLTPEPIRGRVNVPENVGLVAKFLAELRGESQTALCSQTTRNALQLFRLTNTKISK